ncbi:hypothetical protein HELRODRAFT_169912 [Helobdella robusta]|uniref:MARVEL domain-containing protein n=1 Tax=Helobdella robusta TaxID=6412 RepID=T1F2F8_HELRO|nr:hypothetical protein HELRODRAFT_169912 [Helobdella robusta]ESO08174.1 hypothetical protein HELRODRAFT_169912 [Helobdella robusta]
MNQQTSTKEGMTTSFPDEKWRPQQVYIQPNLGYLKDKLGILNVFQTIFSLASLICVITSGVWHSGHDRDDRELWWWRYRLLIFVSVFAALVSISSIIFFISSLNKVLIIDWSLYNIVMYAFISFIYLVVGSLVFDSNFGFHHTAEGNPPAEWSHKYMASAVTASFICVLLYGGTAILAYRAFRREKHYQSSHQLHQRFQLVEKRSNTTFVEGT